MRLSRSLAACEGAILVIDAHTGRGSPDREQFALGVKQ